MIAILAYYGAALVTLVAIGWALSGSRGALWMAVLASWTLSFLASFSIGTYTLVMTFVLLALAIGYSADWIETGTHRVLAALTGVLLWAFAVSTLDDAWLFLPFTVLGSLSG